MPSEALWAKGGTVSRAPCSLYRYLIILTCLCESVWVPRPPSLPARLALLAWRAWAAQARRARVANLP